MTKTAQSPEPAQASHDPSSPDAMSWNPPGGFSVYKQTAVTLCTLIFAALSCPFAHAHQPPLIAGGPAEAWFRIDYEDEPVGYEHLTSRRIQQQTESGDSEPLIRRTRETELKLKRFGRDLSVSSVLSTLETEDGLLLEWSLRRTAGDGTRTQRSGIWSPQYSWYDVTETLQATKRSLQLKCVSQPHSPLIAAWSSRLLEVPATRTRYLVLFPETSAVVDVRFERKSPHGLKLRDGRHVNVTPIVYQPATDPQLLTTLFFSNQGDVLRSDQQVLGKRLVLETADAAIALAGSGVGSLDVDTQTLIPVNRQIKNLKSRDTTRLRIVPGPGGFADIPNSDWQVAEPQPDGSCIVTLTRPTRLDENERPILSVSKKDPRYLQPTDLLNFKTDSVRIITLRGGGAIDNEYDQCLRMTRYLFTNLRRSRFSTSLLPAEQIASAMRGDCTEHATLLAAMMRARGIPSRVATGLIYVERVSAFTTHMWTEAYLDGAWVPFDSATGGKFTAADRIKLMDSPLDFPPSGAVSLFLPLLPLLNDTKIELLTDKP